MQAWLKKTDDFTERSTKGVGLSRHESTQYHHRYYGQHIQTHMVFYGKLEHLIS